MGLFSTLASATSSNNNSNNNNSEGDEGATTTPTSSATIATVVQLYSNQQIILMEDTPSVTGYSSMTYQAVQVGAAKEDAELKNKHSNPDLGVWNCRVVVGSNTENSDPLVDSLLAKVNSPSSVYCVTVDLSDESTVEPNLSALQAALVRHLIERPPPKDDSKKIKTTSLYDLQTVQFGLASDETPAERSIEESAKESKVGLMICAVVSNENKIVDESSESAYKKKQARALVVYHLRKFAKAINAALCFVERPNTEESKGNTTEEKGIDAAENSNDVQLSVSYDKLSQLWRDMATGIAVWEQPQQQQQPNESDTADMVGPTALYGPGTQQEDLIETVLLRNANYPGHWDASKDSLWVALPSSTETSSTNNNTNSDVSGAGDDGWLTQLRDSIASALPVTQAETSETPEKQAQNSGKPGEKDAAVTDFFASLLKNP